MSEGERIRIAAAGPGRNGGLMHEIAHGVVCEENAERLLAHHFRRLAAWRILRHYVEQARGQADFSEVRHVGVDKTATKRGHNYVTLFVDLEGPQRLFGAEGKDTKTFGAF